MACTGRQEPEQAPTACDSGFKRNVFASACGIVGAGDLAVRCGRVDRQEVDLAPPRATGIVC